MGHTIIGWEVDHATGTASGSTTVPGTIEQALAYFNRMYAPYGYRYVSLAYVPGCQG